jgi:hypothetical protein
VIRLLKSLIRGQLIALVTTRCSSRSAFARLKRFMSHKASAAALDAAAESGAEGMSAAAVVLCWAKP